MGRVLEKEWIVLTLLFIWGLFVYYQHLGTPLRGDEGRYAAITRHILRIGDWLRLVYEGQDYLNKPPLHFWQIALSQFVWGTNEFAIRFPAATFGLATMLLVYYCGRSLFHRRMGLMAALIMTTTIAAVWHAHKARFDTAFGFWINLAFFALFQTYRGGGRRLGYLGLAVLSMSVGTMLKGPVAILMPGVGAVAFLLITRRSRILKEIPFLIAGLAICVLITGPYYLLLGSSFDRHFLISENLSRVYVSDKPVLFYCYMIFADFFPWSLFLPCAAWYLWITRSHHLGDEELLLRVWFISFFAFLNVPMGKGERYLVLLIPSFALLIARYWDHLFGASEAPRVGEARLLRFTAIFLATGALVALFVGPRIIQMRYHISDLWPAAFTVLIGIGCVAVWYTAVRQRPRVVFFSALALAMTLTVGLVQYFYPALDRYESGKAIAQQVRAVVGDSPLVIYDPNSWFHEDILYYLDRPSPVPQLLTPEEVHAAFATDRQVFGLFAKSQYEELQRHGGLPLVRLADYSHRRRDFVLVKNRTPL
ncbi:MAG: glycosyltransferase family 39 protein [candidate division NC10 bacterium]|nr:glycosyltransferase family 39 protein [candidate division NC10 bacterium]